MKPFWITFYSYKGGVGRSLAVANTAAMLAQRGRRVLLVDFDLEAPGLDSFSEFANAAGKRGVVEYVSEFIRTNSAPDLREFIHSCHLSAPSRGQLWVMPAGRKDTTYNHDLSRIRWAELYEQDNGHAFFANWKAAVDAEFQPDYVFIDSRTGLTEVGGVCTTFFPDLVVMLFALNEQNVRGIGTVAQSIRQADPDRVPQIHFVATPVPNLPPETPRETPSRVRDERRGLLTERMEAASKVLGVKVNASIHYYPPACLSEKLFVLDPAFSRQLISRDYEILCRQITTFNRTGIDFLLEQMDSAIANDDGLKMEKIAFVLDRDYSDRAEAVFALSQCARARKDSQRAVELAKKAFALDPRHRESFEFLLRHLQRLHQFPEVAAMCKRAAAADVTPKRKSEIELQEGEALMASGNYSDAEDVYNRCLNYAAKAGESSMDILVFRFNTAEAARRSGKPLSVESWHAIVQLFARTEPANAESPPPALANFWQAKHIALACSGSIPAAREALHKARRIAETVGEIDDIFCVRSYTYRPAADFQKDNDSMLAALERGQLWDGMPIPIAQPKDNRTSPNTPNP